MAMLIILAAACDASAQSYSGVAVAKGDSLPPPPAETSARYEHIRQLINALEYPDAVADDFIRWIDGWADVRGSRAVVNLKTTLARSRQAFRRGDISDGKFAAIEERTVLQLCRLTRKQICYRTDYFDLPNIVEKGEANCLGYSQVFYVLGSYLGLTVRPASVTSEHIANIVGLSDETMIVADLTKTSGFISERIIIKARSGGNESHWSFTDDGKLVRGDKTIRIWSRDEVVGELYFCRGTIGYMSGRIVEAIAQYDKAIELSPKCAKAYNNRGGAHLRLGEHTRAISDFDKALELDPDYTSAYHNRANAYLDSDRYEEAVIDYTHAIDLDTKHTKAYFGRGYAHLALDDYAGAVADHTKAIELDPAFARAYYTRAIGYAYLAEDEKAARDMLRAVELDRTLMEDARKVSSKFELNLSLR